MPLNYGAPDARLTRELQEVRTAAQAVVTAMAQANLLPESFPKAVLEDLCAALIGLKDGTAENCRPTLDYAYSRLLVIRRAHFAHEDDGAADFERLHRGAMLDDRMSALLLAISSAREEYRAQAQEEQEADQPLEKTIALGDSGAAIEGILHATAAAGATIQARKGLQAHGLDQHEKGEILARRLQDGTNLALAARSQLKAKEILKRSHEAVATAIGKTPDLIKAAGGALEKCADAAQILGDWWVETVREAVNGSVQQLRSLGVALKKVGAVWARPKGELPPPTPEEIERANAEAVRLLKAGLEVPDAIARIAEEVDFKDLREKRKTIKIVRWRDLEKFMNLRSLDLYNTDFNLADHGAHLSGKPLQTLLNLSTASATDLTPLGALTNLTSLTLFANRVTDLAPLDALTNLASLHLVAHSATDLTPLSALTNLNGLYLLIKSATDLAPLGALTNLTSLTLSADSATDLAPLLQLIAMKRLSIQSKGELDLSPFAALKNLKELDLWGVRPLNQSALKNVRIRIYMEPDKPTQP